MMKMWAVILNGADRGTVYSETYEGAWSRACLMVSVDWEDELLVSEISTAPYTPVKKVTNKADDSAPLAPHVAWPFPTASAPDETIRPPEPAYASGGGGDFGGGGASSSWSDSSSSSSDSSSSSSSDSGSCSSSSSD